MIEKMINDDISDAVIRIEKMEILFDFLAKSLRDDTYKNSILSVKEAVNALSCYYESGNWLHDYELDEQRLLPCNLKRGVLAQDGLYELLTEFKEITDK